MLLTTGTIRTFRRKLKRLEVRKTCNEAKKEAVTQERHIKCINITAS
jgi:hypothetical protein